jgi:hypothetical protein
LIAILSVSVREGHDLNQYDQVGSSASPHFENFGEQGAILYPTESRRLDDQSRKIENSGQKA